MRHPVVVIYEFGRYLSTLHQRFHSVGTPNILDHIDSWICTRGPEQVCFLRYQKILLTLLCSSLLLYNILMYFISYLNQLQDILMVMHLIKRIHRFLKKSPITVYKEFDDALLLDLHHISLSAHMSASCP